MFYVVDFIFFFFFLFYIGGRKIKYIEMLMILFVGFVGFFLNDYIDESIEFVIVFVSTFSLLFLYLKSKDLALALTVSWLSLGILLSIPFPSINIWHFFARDLDFTFINTLYYIIKIILFVVFFLIYKHLYTKDSRMQSFIFGLHNTVASVIGIIYFFYFIGIYHEMRIDNDIFFHYIFIIGGISYGAILVMVYLFDRRVHMYEELQVEMERRNKDAEMLMHESQLKVFSDIKLYLEEDRLDLIQTYTRNFLDRKYENRYQQTLTSLNDQKLEMYIYQKISNHPEIEFTLSVIDFEINMISLSDVYFFEIFGIILDNAIEAAANSKSKEVSMLFGKDSIRVSNSYIDEDLEKMMLKKSDKGNPDRINGLKLLRYLIERSSIIVLSRVNSYVTYEMVVEI